MKKANIFKGKFKKKLIIVIGSLISFVVIVLLFVSPIVKYLIEKYDEKYTGRQITMDMAYVNPFTGFIHFSNLKVYEFQSDSVFVSANGVSINVTVFKIFSKTYEISEISINRPYGIVLQNRAKFNYNDLLDKISPPQLDSTITKNPIHFNILSVKVNDGDFYYNEEIIPVKYFIKKVDFDISGIRWDADTLVAKFSFLSGMGSGDVKGNLTINVKNMDYRFNAVAHTFDLNIIGQYLKDLTNYGAFTANLDADISAKGNLNDKENITAKGMLAINDFHFGKNPTEDYASFDKLVVVINEISPKNHIYLFDSISLDHPYFKYERYDYLDNLQTMFGKNGDNIISAQSNPAKFNLVIEIADYIKILSKNFFKSDYKINRLAINKGDIKFNDYSLSEKFSIDLSPLYVVADSIDKNHKRVSMAFNSGIKPYGKVSVSLSINPKDSSDFDMKYSFQKLPATIFNPYIISYTSFPLDRGTVEINGIWNVRNGSIRSNNHLLVIDARVAKRVKNKLFKWIPLPLIMAFVRERGNVIDYQIPITGNLKDPKFKLRDVIFDILKNIFVKPVTIPYRREVKNVEIEIEKSLSVKWKTRSSSFSSNQKKFIKKMADFLVENPDASIAIYPQQYETKEKEYILFFEAKKIYFLKANNKNIQSFSEGDSVKVDKMSVKNTLFVQYLNKQINDPMVFTIQEKCTRLVGLKIVNAKFEQLNKNRKKDFVSFFEKAGIEKQIKIHTANNVIPYNGFSFYEIEYKGELPKSLMKAYRKMNELNEEPPRRKFKKQRM